MNRKKFKQLVLYIASRSEDDTAFGAVKLNKLLYYCDFRAFALLGHSLTEADYIRRPLGPVPNQITSVRNELVQARDAILERRDYHGYGQDRLVSQVNSDLSIFESEEIQLVDSVLGEFAGLNAAEMTRRSHQELGWQAAMEGETIPYETAFLSDEPLSQEDVSRGQELAHEHGWRI